MVTNVYCPSWEPVELTSDDPDSPTHTKAYIFVADTTHACLLYTSPSPRD